MRGSRRSGRSRVAERRRGGPRSGRVVRPGPVGANRGGADDDRSWIRSAGSMNSSPRSRSVATCWRPRKRRCPSSPERATGPVERLAAASAARALENRRLADSIETEGDERLELLRDSLLAASRTDAVTAIRAVALLRDDGAISVALENLSGADAAQRANALEVIETSVIESSFGRCWPSGSRSDPATSTATGESGRCIIRMTGSAGARSGRPRLRRPEQEKDPQRKPKTTEEAR